MAIALQYTAQSGCNEVEPMVYHVIAMMPITYCHSPLRSLRQLINYGMKKSYANRDRSRIFRNHRPSLPQDSITGRRKVCYTKEICSPTLSQTLYSVIAAHSSPLFHPDHTSLTMKTQRWCRCAT
jgi:hypothetical protein